jgi:hypothetical protein
LRSLPFEIKKVFIHDINQQLKTELYQLNRCRICYMTKIDGRSYFQLTEITARLCGLADHRYNLVRFYWLEELSQDVPKMATLTQSEELWPSSYMPPIRVMKLEESSR